MILSRYTLRNVDAEKVVIPQEALFELPEKVLQFGTGVLLRGLPDYFIDKANRQGIFGGRIVVVKSTSHGDTSAFDKQDCLYTLCVRGLQNGEKVEENIINSSISRVLTATEEWEQVLECAHNAQMQIIISNTTEVGIQLVNDDVRHHPPKSFPGKLLAFLHERYKAFEGSEHSGMVIVPTELIPENGTKLQAIVLELAHLNGLEDAFIEWVECCNYFCNSLVDRIVPGKPDVSTVSSLESELGYTDGLLAVSEVYRLWAIEGDDHIKNILSFAQVDEGIVIEPNIDIFRELKLRMLNGTHTLSCGLAYLAGCETVKSAMDDETVSNFITDVMQQEIAPSIPYDVDLGTAHDFGNKVLDRFRNPHIQHQWLSITMNYSSKLRLRCVPVLLKHYEKSEDVPEAFALGFAAYLYFMKAVTERDGKYYGELDGASYYIQDELAETFYHRWSKLSPAELVKEVLHDVAYWGEDLYSLPGFAEAVTQNLNSIINSGVRKSIEIANSKKVVAA
ncbi:MAG: tagaturonate reductase [Flavisolibacter sp.]|jgi:tagaturonate reductase|nr:tagaturonate reductase [Flavisolibacter sp.]